MWIRICVLSCLFGGVVGGTTASPPPDAIQPEPATYSAEGMKYDYGKALSLSILFYDAQRAGRLPANNPIGWRGDSFVDDADGIDLEGGWFDAGDHVKFGFPMAYTVWFLNYGFLKFHDGYKAAGQVNMYCDMIKWPLDYFLKAWKPDQQRLYTQVGDGQADHQHWESPENIDMERPAHYVDTECPGSEVAADTASAFATGYLAFKRHCGDEAYAAQLKEAAISLYAFANDYRGSYSECYSDAASFYSSDGYQDELAVAGVWLYRVTHEQVYIDNAAAAYNSGSLHAGIEWNNKGTAAELLLYEVTHEEKYFKNVTNYLGWAMQTGRATYTPCGLVYLDRWGTARHASNAALVALIAAEDDIAPVKLKKWALSQINYILGDNNYGISYEVGFGDYYPTRYHHRGSSCVQEILDCDIETDEDNPNLLYGALVGGPNQNDEWENDREDYVRNEVATDYNAGFQGALAALVYFSEKGELPASPDPVCTKE